MTSEINNYVIKTNCVELLNACCIALLGIPHVMEYWIKKTVLHTEHMTGLKMKQGEC